MPASDIKFPLRIPVELDAVLRKLAVVGQESLNAVICGILRKGVGIGNNGNPVGKGMADANKDKDQAQGSGTLRTARGGSHDRGGASEDRSGVAGPSETTDCPDCGDPMIWNDKTKRWNCECGFQMKAKR